MSQFRLADHPAATALARALLPPGRRLPGADAGTLVHLDELLAELAPAAPARAAALASALDHAALLATGRRFRALPADRQQALLQRWERDPLMRYPVALATAVLKAAHFDDPARWQVFGATRPHAGPPAPDRRLDQVKSGDGWRDGESLDCDVVVIGTGAGGAVVGKELAARGQAVLFLEEGDLHRRDSFGRGTLESYRRFYRDRGAVFAVGNHAIPVFMGRMVGGSTAINTATCFRTPDWVLDDWCERLGTDELSPARMAPHFQRVEAELGVAPAAAAHLGGSARVVARGCQELGWRSFPLRRNAPDCDGQGVCGFGCPTDAKRSTNLSYVPRALACGAMLVTGMRAERILVDRGRAVGVTARATRGGARLTVHARAVVLAGGAVPSPRLLLDQGLCRGSGRLGHGLSLHPATSAGALFEERIAQWSGIPQALGCDEFHREGILMLGASMPIDVGAVALQMAGRRFAELMDDYDRVASFGVMVEDDSRGRVRLGPGRRALLTYRLGERAVERLHRGVAHLAEIYFAAGARRVMPQMPRVPVIESRADLRRFRGERFSARDFLLTSFHPLGTVPMGRDPRTSVVGLDHQAHELPGLYVVDGSTVPGPPAVNPQITIMAMADRAAAGIAGGLS